MNKLSYITSISRYASISTTRCVSTTRVCLGKKFGWDKDAIDHEDSLMKKAPEWKENNATESEADVKADHERYVDPQRLKEETAEYIRSHKDKDGSIKK